MLWYHLQTNGYFKNNNHSSSNHAWGIFENEYQSEFLLFNFCQLYSSFEKKNQKFYYYFYLRKLKLTYLENYLS